MEERVICGKCKIGMQPINNLGFDDSDVTRYRCNQCGNETLIAWSI